METVLDIDVLGDEGFRARMLRWSGVVFVATVVLTALAFVLPGTTRGVAVSLVVAAVASLVVLPVHELVHAAAFKLLGGAGCRVSFGYASGCLYTRTNDVVLTRGRFVAVLLAPSVVLTLLLVGLGAAVGEVPCGILAAGLHLTGCTGDLTMVGAIVSTPGVTHVQDTEVGCRLLSSK